MRIIGIGTDITECARIARMLEKHPEHFTRRVFTEIELDYCARRNNRVEHFTGRWAAKEAVLKALGTGWITGITWRDVEVVNEAGGKPTIRLFGGALAAADRRGIDDVQISISHCPSHAVAFAVAVAGNEALDSTGDFENKGEPS